MNVFMKNPLIPDGMLALVKITDGMAETIWYGPMSQIPGPLFEIADQTHCSETTYNEIAAKAAATGKGQTLQ